MFKYLLAVCLVASVAAAHPHPEEIVSGAVPSVISAHQNAPVVLQSVPAPEVQVGPVGVEHVHQPPVAPSYYGPGSIVHMYGNDHIVGNKPVQAVRNLEQFGQPEPAALPANYKPWGSWGLYIGGNPADGYYSNYYKALSGSVDKQVYGGEAKPVGAEQTVAFSPVVRQASSLPYLGADYYPFAYSPGELNSVSRSSVESVPAIGHGPVGPVAPIVPVSPVQAGAQVYGSPASFESNSGVSSYSDSYATKKLGGSSPSQTKGTSKSLPPAPVASQTKGFQTRSFVYPVVGQLSAPLPQAQQQQQVAPVVNQQHVVAYPVPIGSQIVGSQLGIDGAFAPYGVHAFTRYAVKPTLVEPATYFHNSPYPYYGNQYYSQYYSPYYTPYSYYNTYYNTYASPAVHYSAESAPQEPQYSPVTATVEVVSEKAESDDKLYTKGQTKI